MKKTIIKILTKLKKIKIIDKRSLWVLGFFVIFYISFFFYLISSQDDIIYHPPNRDFYLCGEFPEQTKIAEHKQTRMYHRHNPKSDKVVIFYHGNGNVACDLGFLANSFEVTGVSYIFPEYSGYGGDGKEPVSEEIKHNVKDVIDYIETQNYKEIIVIGQSVGTGVAGYHVSESLNVNKLLLISPFDNIIEVATRRFVFYPDFLIRLFVNNPFDNLENLKEFDGELVILHGDKDIIIPIERGKNLFESLKNENKEMIVIEGAGHNDVFDKERVLGEIKRFIRNRFQFLENGK